MIFTSEINVEVIQQMGGDDMIARAAKVSTLTDRETVTPDKLKGLINYLMKSRHGSCYEQGALTLRVEAPIFVFREWHRHRIASYNEVSGRYTELEAKFYVPSVDRKMIPVPDPGDECTGQLPTSNLPCPGKLHKVEAGLKMCTKCGKHYKYHSSARPKFQSASESFHKQTVEVLEESYKRSWEAYQTLLKNGIAKEVARVCLPVGIFSSMYVTMNPRSLMNFLSLRTEDERASVISRPQWEIQVAARQVEAIFAKLWPVTYQAFNDNGRVAP